MSEEARVTPSHPVVSLLVGLSRSTIPLSRSFIVPLSVLGFGFQTVKSKAMSPGMKVREGMRNRGWERPGGGNLAGAGEISSDRRWIALPKYCVIHPNFNDISGMSAKRYLSRADKNQTDCFITSQSFFYFTKDFSHLKTVSYSFLYIQMYI